MANVEPIEPTTQQPISDDQELAKVLAGVSQQADETAEAGAGTTFGQLPTDDSADDSAVVATGDDAASDVEATVPEEVSQMPPVAEPELVPSVPPVAAPEASGDLDSVKQEALTELRPLVDKLNVSAEEKFDTYLLLLRSTDDKNLIAPAHEAAKGIADEARRAQALLDIIKEIDFLSGASQQQP